MPYCTKCGAQNYDGDKFCMKCGNMLEGTLTRTTNAQVSPMALQEDTRKASLSEINRMISYFGPMQAQYDEYDDCNEKISYFSNPKSVVRVSGSSGKLLKIFGIIMIAVGSELGLPIMAIVAASDSESSGVLGILFFLSVIAGGITLLVLGIKKTSNYNDSVKTERERLLNYYEERSDQLADELNTHYINYGYCAVAASYTNPRILSLIRDPIYMGRADTIKEAINIMIMDSHNSEMELQASLTAQSAASAAHSAKAAAFFSAATFVSSLRR